MLTITPVVTLLLCLAAAAQQGTTRPVTRPAPGGVTQDKSTREPGDRVADERRNQQLADEVTALREAVQKLLGEKPTTRQLASMIVNGETLPRLVIEREVIYLVGSRHLKQKIIELIIDEQVEEQIKKGEDRRRFEILEKDLDDAIRASKTEWEKANPDKGTFEDYLRTTNTSMEEYRTLLRNSKIFDGIFFPGHPRTWPPVTQEAILASGGGQGNVFWERFRDSVPPIYLASFEVTWTAALDAVKAAGLKVSKEDKATGDITARIVLAEGTSDLAIKLEKKGGAEDRTELRALPVNQADLAKEPVQNAINRIGQLTAEAVGRSIGKPADQSYTGEVPPIMLMVCRNWVIERLTEWSDVRYASDGLPDDLVLKVNAKGWSTADANKVFLQKAKPEDFERAITEIAARTALRQELEKNKAWLSDEEFRKEYKKYATPEAGTLFTAEVMAINFKGYPTMEAFKQRWRLLKSFENMIAKDINDESLREHIPHAKNFLGDSRMAVQYIRVPAFDDAMGTWRENGWARARAEADAAMSAIEKGMTFDEAIKNFGKYRPGDAEGGRLSAQSVNELRQRLGESEYLDFINGYSVARILLNETREGQVIGPLRANDGYVIAKLVSRAPPAPVTLEEKRELLKQDYISTRFLRWAGEVAARMTLE